MNQRHLLMAAGLLCTAGLAVFTYQSSDSDLAEPVVRHRPEPTEVAGKKVIRSSTILEAGVQSDEPVHILDLLPRGEMMDEGEPSGHGLFSGNSPIPASMTQTLAPPPPPPPPMAPPLPFACIGSQTTAGKTQVYLTRGEEVFVVGEQSVIQNTYRVKSIGPQTMTLVYLPLDQVQQLSIGVTN
jgi:hypothetical protein